MTATLASCCMSLVIVSPMLSSTSSAASSLHSLRRNSSGNWPSSPQNRGPVPNASRFTELEARRGFKHHNGADAGLLIGTWRYPAIRSPKTMDGAGTHAATQALLPLAIFMLGPMRSTETFSHVSAEQVGDVYLFSSGEPEVWNPTGYKRCLGPISESRTPEYLGTVINTALYQLRMLYKFKSSRDFPLAKLDTSSTTYPTI